MDASLAEKLTLVLKALSMDRKQVAVRLSVDKSAVGRWLTGAARPSPQSLTHLSALVAEQIPGFSAVDWDRPIGDLAGRLGLIPVAAAPSRAARLAASLPAAMVDALLDNTEIRADAYEGFYKSTRPFAQYPGLFIHDHIMIRREESGVLGLVMGAGGVFVRGWVFRQQNQLFIIAAEQTTGALGFAIMNGVNATEAAAMDGIVLNCSLDAGRTPTASAMYVERIGDLSGDHDADDARITDLCSGDPVAAPGSVSDRLACHLARDVGPAALAAGGDWVLSMPIARTLSRGALPPSLSPPPLPRPAPAD